MSEQANQSDEPVQPEAEEEDHHQTPGTGIFGDETLVAPLDGVSQPGVADHPPESVKPRSAHPPDSHGLA